MTCIVAITDGSTVLMGGDSCVAYPSIRITAKHRKVILRVGEKDNAPWGIGFAGSFRSGELAEFFLKLPPVPRNLGDLRKVMSCEVGEQWRVLCKEKELRSKDDDDAGVENDGRLLIGVSGRIFEVCVDSSVIEHSEPFLAIGSGMPFAMASLATSLKIRPQADKEDHLRLALECAARFGESICEPFNFVSVPPPVPPARRGGK